MNKLFFVFIIVFWVQSNAFQSKKCLVKEKIISYYYLNGVGNVETSIRDSVKLIKQSLKVDAKSIPNEKTYNFFDDYIFYPTIDMIGKLIPNKIAEISSNNFPTTQQIMDTFTQKEQEKLILKYREIQEYQNLGYVQSTEVDTNKEITERIRSRYLEILGEAPLEKDRVSNMEKVLDDKALNIILAHSQGNLYANNICYITKKKLEIMRIAPPTKDSGCGDFYVLFKNDKVISGLGLTKDILPGNFSNLGNSFIAHNFDYYLEQYNTRRPIEVHLQSIQKKEFKAYDFPLISLTIEPNPIHERAIANAVQGVKDAVDNTQMFFRKSGAEVTGIQFMSDIIGSDFIKTLMNLNFKDLSSKKFQKMLDTELNVKSDQEYADFLGMIHDKLKTQCDKGRNKLPVSLREICDPFQNFEYFSSTENKSTPQDEKFKSYLLGTSDNLKMLVDTTISLNCLDAGEYPETNVVVRYRPELKKKFFVQVRSIGIEEKIDPFIIYPKDLGSKSVIDDYLGLITVTNKDGMLTAEYSQRFEEINKPQDLSSLSEGFKECNSLSKVFRPNCKTYFNKLLVGLH